MTADYVYTVPVDTMTHEEAKNNLKAKLGNTVVDGYPDPRPESPEVIHEVEDRLRMLGVSTQTTDVDVDEFYTYIEEAHYDDSYYVGNRHEKMLEHFCCVKFLNLTSGCTFVDVASEHSPLSDIMSRLTCCKSYAQDISYPQGIIGNKIGSDATSIPLPAESIDGLALTCSLEHFEGTADIATMTEMERLLKRNGKVIVVPLYMYIHLSCLTDPRAAVAGDVDFDPGSVIYLFKDWGNRHGRFYSPEALINRIIKPNRLLEAKVNILGNPEAIHDSVYCRFILELTKK